MKRNFHELEYEPKHVNKNLEFTFPSLGHIRLRLVNFEDNEILDTFEKLVETFHGLFNSKLHNFCNWFCNLYYLNLEHISKKDKLTEQVCRDILHSYLYEGSQYEKEFNNIYLQF